jgi:hypothetical protein
MIRSAMEGVIPTRIIRAADRSFRSCSDRIMIHESYSYLVLVWDMLVFICLLTVE